ncbi:hypothetical protein HYC85_012307 [Camellia sinensis]|uniref:Uncharacterized protein n=1 Tax=Camellia sinensis TaxID=4442 RepID=A0A7J7HEI7_CAMSI|nr:hypothetical protein HYC85_012307 [Camellia sinensis]
MGGLSILWPSDLASKSFPPCKCPNRTNVSQAFSKTDVFCYKLRYDYEVKLHVNSEQY